MTAMKSNREILKEQRLAESRVTSCCLDVLGTLRDLEGMIERNRSHLYAEKLEPQLAELSELLTKIRRLAKECPF